MASLSSSNHILPLETSKYITPRLNIDIDEPSPNFSNPSRRSRVWASPTAAFPKFRMQQQRARIPTHFSNDRNRDDESAPPTSSERPPIPSALSNSSPQGAYSTPLPVLSIIVLSITMLGEFLTANVSTPFLLFMVEGFLVNSDAGADAGYWTGILVSMFFLSQFLTSLLWATVAERHGSRTVLFISLLGSSITCTIFGTSQSLKEAIATRLLQGIFAGSMGVARSTIANITDKSNEGRAYAILGFAWGLGGVAGAIIGGAFESPVKKWPDAFSHVPIFVRFPYLLPCMIASSVTLIGAILSLFLARDGGPRGGAIRLTHDKEDFEPIPEEDELIDTEARTGDNPNLSTSFASTLLNKIYGFFKRQYVSQNSSLPRTDHAHAAFDTPTMHSTGRPPFRTSRATGTAYGYGTSRSRLSSHTYSNGRSSIGSFLHRRRSAFGNLDIQPSTSLSSEATNFTQRLLMANEMAVTNIADLWVAAAMNVDNDDVLLSNDEENDAGVHDTFQGEPDPSGTGFSPPSPDVDSSRIESTSVVRNEVGSRRLSFQAPSLSPTRFSERTKVFRSHITEVGTRAYRPQAAPTTSSQIPSIYANSGLRAPPGILYETDSQGMDGVNVLDTVHERQASAQQSSSTFKQLPWMIIIQYGLLALHSTTHDQIFLSYLVSKYDVGGLGLLAENFAQLIAVMSLAQIVYQFYLYPNIGPPRGRFSHLAMFRVGALLFIPAYLSVPIYRTFINTNANGNLFVMSLLILSTSIRYCGGTFGYTAIAILLNYVSPPHIIGMANGLAQSIVSFARFAGPILGGYVWSISVQSNPGGYPLGFLFCAGICAAAVLLSFLIR